MERPRVDFHEVIQEIVHYLVQGFMLTLQRTVSVQVTCWLQFLLKTGGNVRLYRQGGGAPVRSGIWKGLWNELDAF